MHVEEPCREEDKNHTKIGPYQIVKKIGEGSFGTIYQGFLPSSQQQIYAIKTESINNIKLMLLLEYQIYQELNKTQCRGIPKVKEYGEEEHFNYMSMQVFNHTLDKFLLEKYGKNEKNLTNIPLDIHLLIMNQTLKIIQNIHFNDYVYRDVKPANFMLKQPYNQLYIIDFGLCKKYMKNQTHINMKTGKKLVGTPIFCSRKTHAGIQQSRRDDLESWFFMTLYLVCELPWQQFVNKKDISKEEQYRLIGEKKDEVEWEKFIKENGKLPRCLLSIFHVLQKLEFTERPNYEYLHALISDEYKKLVGKELPNQIQWDSKIKQKKVQNKKIKINFKVPNSKLTKKTSEVKDEQKELEKQNLAE